ncbi:MAG: DNA polymerase, partial [Gammaproteobacteria bacterium]|nr:DNA polymerase [Gammaproteobacteria bacterium]
FDKLKNDLGCYKQQMFMDREVIADRGFWTAKKRYALRVLDNEGVRYDEPSYKTMGLSLVQSRTPEWVRSKLLDGIKIILQSDDENRVAEYIDCVKKEFISLPLEETAFNVKVGDIAKYSTKEKPYYKGGTQAQLKAVILHNKMVEKYPDIPKLNTGESVKWLWLQPNPTGEEVIAFDTFLPKEFDLENYVCYNTQFEKTFQTPLMDICKAINIKYENVFELDGFFS